MTDSASPFEDPQLLEMLKQYGIQHRPGMADELMQDLAPLLAADGYDMDNLDEDVDIDELNAAMSRATERRNMELVTPVGPERDRTINTLREIAMAFNSTGVGAVGPILEKLRPNPTKRYPSYGHMMGVSLETLDTWHADKQLRSALKRVSLKNMPPAVQDLAPDIQALARKGRAFRSIDSLLRKNNGGILADTGAYLVAASVVAIAVKRQESFSEVLNEMLPGAKVTGDSAPGSAFGPVAAEQVSSHQYVKKFGDWLAEYEGQTGIEAEDIELFEMLVNAAQQQLLDPHDPEDFDHWIDMVMELEDPAAVDWSLAVLHEYVHFRTHHDEDAGAWEDPHEMISEATVGAPGMAKELAAALEAAQEISPEHRHQALNDLPLISGILELRDWLGKSKPITGTAVPKRADIKTVAAMIGLDARGVARVPDHGLQSGRGNFPHLLASEHEPQSELDLPELPEAEAKQTVYVQSALELQELMAWWWTLEELDIIMMTSTTVRLSPAGQELLSSDTVPLQAAEGVVAGVVQKMLNGTLSQSPFEVPATSYAISQIIDSIAEESGDGRIPQDVFGGQLIEMVAERQLRQLADLGLLELPDGKPFIPEALRVPVVDGLLLAIQGLAEFVDVQELGPEQL